MKNAPAISSSRTVICSTVRRTLSSSIVLWILWVVSSKACNRAICCCRWRLLSISMELLLDVTGRTPISSQTLAAYRQRAVRSYCYPCRTLIVAT